MSGSADIPQGTRTIIHLDMDCFYAAIEVRERPELRGKPVGVGGRSRRSVLTTCSYEARRFGCRSAMPVFKALRLCPGLVVIPPRFEVYSAESRRIRAILARFSPQIEPLSLDEAYIDVSHLRSAGSAVAREIRFRIREETGLAASAGIAPNKLLSKIASDWNKPDGQLEIRPEEVAEFMRGLPVKRLWGVGGKTAARMAEMGVQTCADLQGWDRTELAARFGRFGLELFDLCRGIDHRPVRTDRIRKSLSTERTFQENLASLDACLEAMDEILAAEAHDLEKSASGRVIAKVVVKMKFEDFRQTTVERGATVLDHALCRELLAQAWERGNGSSVRLIGVGVRFREAGSSGPDDDAVQMSLL